MKYLNRYFSVGGTNQDVYSEGWERTFGKKPTPPQSACTRRGQHISCDPKAPCIKHGCDEHLSCYCEVEQ